MTTKIPDTDLVVLPEGPREGSFGGIVYWSLSGTVHAQTLKELAETWTPLPLPLPTMYKLRGAVHVALTQMFGRDAVRWVPELSAHIVMRERVQDREVADGVEKKWTADAAYTVAVDKKTQELTCSGLSPQEVLSLQSRIRLIMTTHDTSAISAWLCYLVEQRFSGLRLRTAGGIYYIPPTHVPDWFRLTQAVRHISQHSFYYIPALRTQDAAEAIIHALNADIQREATALQTGLTSLTKKSIDSRYTQVASLRTKIRSYEELLGHSMEQLTEQLSSVEVQLAQATAAVLLQEGS